MLHNYPIPGSNLTRLHVMMSINHPEEYYQKALESQGIDYSKLTHQEIAVFVAVMKAVEADALIETAQTCEKADSVESLDLSILVPRGV